MSKIHPKGVARFSVSLQKDLLKLLDRMVAQKGYSNRSLAIADMVRNQLVEHRQEQERAVGFER